MFSNVPVGWLFVIYFALAGGIVFLSKKLADYVDALDKKTKISGAFIGAVLLAAVTSLPELFTSVSATILLPDSADLVIGNILGSNLFNIAVLGVAFVIFFVMISKSKVQYKTQFIVIAATLAIYGVIAYGIMAPETAQPKVGPINLLVLLIFGLYIAAILLEPKNKDDDEEEKEDPLPKLSVKQVVIRFIICAVLLVAVSIFITYTTDELSVKLDMNKTVGGAIFLAIATSLPELTSTFVLCKKGNFDAALGDITGSCLFNFMIIGLAEFMSYRVSLLRGFSSANPDQYADAMLMLILTVICFIFLFISLVIHKNTNEKNKPIKKWHYALYIFVGLVMTAGYVLFLIF